MGFYSDTSFRRRVISLVGGFMLHLVIGTLYTFGNFVIYLASYLRAQGADITLTELEAIFPIQVASSTVFNMIGTYSTLHTNQYL